MTKKKSPSLEKKIIRLIEELRESLGFRTYSGFYPWVVDYLSLDFHWANIKQVRLGRGKRLSLENLKILYKGLIKIKNDYRKRDIIIERELLEPPLGEDFLKVVTQIKEAADWSTKIARYRYISNQLNKDIYTVKSSIYAEGKTSGWRFYSQLEQIAEGLKKGQKPPVKYLGRIEGKSISGFARGIMEKEGKTVAQVDIDLGKVIKVSPATVKAYHSGCLDIPREKFLEIRGYYLRRSNPN